jgi:tetratricopeptide (TPR) repeat protein
MYVLQGRYAEAEPLFKRALVIKEQQLGTDHPDTVGSLDSLAVVYQEQGNYTEAEPLFQRALATRERQLGVEHPRTQIARENYTRLLQLMKQKEE